MPRKIPKQAEEIEEPEYEEDSDEIEEELEEDMPAPEPTRRRVVKRKPAITKPKPRPKPVQRYGVVAPTPIRIADAETGEVVGEGEYAIYQALADIIERLERIETAIGSMTE